MHYNKKKNSKNFSFTFHKWNKTSFKKRLKFLFCSWGLPHPHWVARSCLSKLLLPPSAPVLIPTVSNESHKVPGALRHCLNGSVIFGRQLQLWAAATQTVTDVLPRPCDAKSATHNDSTHCGAVQHIACCDTGHWAVMFLGNGVQGD